MRLRRQQCRQQEILQVRAQRSAGKQPARVDRSHREIEQRPPVARRRTAQIEGGLKSQRAWLLEAGPFGKPRLQRLTRYLHDKLRAIVRPSQPQTFARRDHRRHGALAKDAIVAKADLHRALDRYLHQVEIFQRARPNVDGWADAHQIEGNTLKIGAANDPGNGNVRQPAQPVRLEHAAQPMMHRLEIVRRELTIGRQREAGGPHHSAACASTC